MRTGRTRGGFGRVAGGFKNASGRRPSRRRSECGQVFFGESKIQEAKAKIPLCPGRARWHFIGHLQSNKVRDAVELFEMIQSVDSLALAREISKRCEQAGKTMPVLLEVNVAGEASKFGYAPEQMLAELNEMNALPQNRNSRADGRFRRSRRCRRRRGLISGGCAN